VEPPDRPAGPGRLQAPPGRRADETGLAPGTGPGQRGAGMTMQLTMTVNGEEVTREVEPRLLLVHFLRDDLGLTGTHRGCDTSNCGVCVVLLGGVPAKSCTVLAPMPARHRVDPGEGMAHIGQVD